MVDISVRMSLRQERTLHRRMHRRKMPISESITRVPLLTTLLGHYVLGVKVLDTCIANLKPQCGISGAKA